MPTHAGAEVRRVRGIQHQRIYRIDRERDYGALTPLVGRGDRTLEPELIAEQWDRMGQFYASLRSGHVTASVASKRLLAFSPTWPLFAAGL